MYYPRLRYAYVSILHFLELVDDLRMLLYMSDMFVSVDNLWFNLDFVRRVAPKLARSFLD